MTVCHYLSTICSIVFVFLVGESSQPKKGREVRRALGELGKLGNRGDDR